MTGRKSGACIYLLVSIALSLAGFAGFLFLFARDFNVFWLILSPVIIALYQIPAVFFFWKYRRARRRPSPGEPASGTGLDDAPRP